jgi:RNA polymerase sigma-70 factor (ECF subfamily)
MADDSETDNYADFIRRVRLGDEQAAEQLVRRYEPEIRLEIRARLRMRDQRLRRHFDSVDVCQQVLASFFVRAAVGDFDLDDPQQLIRLLVGMARNKLASQVRHHYRKSRDVRRVDSDDAGEAPLSSTDETPSQVVSGRELLAEFRSRLSDDEMRVADLRAKGLEWGAVAESLGGTPEGRRKQLSRAIARVGQELGIDTIVA